jgi:DNA recombination protein RmuC
MSDTHFLILLAAAILIALLQLIVLLRKPRIELPPELLAQLQRLEQQGQATRMEVAKNDGALDGMANQLQGFTQATSHSLEAVRQAAPSGSPPVPRLRRSWRSGWRRWTRPRVWR